MAENIVRPTFFRQAKKILFESTGTQNEGACCGSVSRGRDLAPLLFIFDSRYNVHTQMLT